MRNNLYEEVKKFMDFGGMGTGIWHYLHHHQEIYGRRRVPSGLPTLLHSADANNIVYSHSWHTGDNQSKISSEGII